MVYTWSLKSRDLLRAIELPASAQTARKIEFVSSNGPADKVCNKFHLWQSDLHEHFGIE